MRSRRSGWERKPVPQTEQLLLVHSLDSKRDLIAIDPPAVRCDHLDLYTDRVTELHVCRYARLNGVYAGISWYCTHRPDLGVLPAQFDQHRPIGYTETRTPNQDFVCGLRGMRRNREVPRHRQLGC